MRRGSLHPTEEEAHSTNRNLKTHQHKMATQPAAPGGPRQGAGRTVYPSTGPTTKERSGATNSSPAGAPTGGMEEEVSTSSNPHGRSSPTHGAPCKRPTRNMLCSGTGLSQQLARTSHPPTAAGAQPACVATPGPGHLT